MGLTVTPVATKPAVLPPPAKQPHAGMIDTGSELVSALKARTTVDTGIGRGYLPHLRRNVEALDLVRGLDRLLGKTLVITPFIRSPHSRAPLLGTLRARELLGPLSGKLIPTGERVDLIL